MTNSASLVAFDGINERELLSNTMAMRTSLQQQVLNRIRAEFIEMPDMKLTIEEIQRLCDVNRSLCETAIESLVQAHFLCVTSDRRYTR